MFTQQISLTISPNTNGEFPDFLILPNSESQTGYVKVSFNVLITDPKLEINKEIAAIQSSIASDSQKLQDLQVEAAKY